MTEELTPYKSLLNDYNILFKAAKECRDKLKKNGVDLNTRAKYDIFNEQLNDIRKELRAYDKIKIYAKKGNYKKVDEMSLENPNLKEALSKENLIDFINYYQRIINKISINNKNLRSSKKSLEKTLGNIKDNLEEIRRNLI